MSNDLGKRNDETRKNVRGTYSSSSEEKYITSRPRGKSLLGGNLKGIFDELLSQGIMHKYRFAHRKPADDKKFY